MQLRYEETEDRLLLRLSTTDDCEFRFWLTRRFVKRLWPMLVQMLEWDKAVQQQLDPDTRHAVLDFQHEGYSAAADYKTQFQERTPDAPRRMPLGEAPVLLGKAEGKKQSQGVQILRLHPLHGTGIDMTVDTKLLHVFMRLLREQVGKTDWDVNLALYEGAADAMQPGHVEPQRLN